MPPNFTKLTLRYIGILVILNFLLGLGQQYIFQFFSHSRIEYISYCIAVINFFIFSTILGFGIRELCRSNHHQNSAGSVFLFAFWLVIIPTLMSILITYIYSFSNEQIKEMMGNYGYRYAIFTGFLMSIFNALLVINFAGLWRVFRKAEIKPWWSLIPIVNLFGLVKVAKLESYWTLVLLIPILNLITLAYLAGGISKAFNKPFAYALALYFLPFIFYPILGFGNAKYLYRKEEEELWIGDHLIE